MSLFRKFSSVAFLKKNLAILILLAFTFLGIFLLYNKFIYTFGFTDEGDNISIGKFILQDKKLYSEVFSQHQPLTYYVSAGLQQVTNPDNILLVVRRHRQAILIFSFLWILFLTYRFGYRLLPFFFLIEFLKYYYLGHLFLAESLVIYPLIFLFCLFWQGIMQRNISRFDCLIASLSAFFVAFNLLPTVAAVGCIVLSLLWFTRKNVQQLLLLIVPIIVTVTILFSFVSLPSFIETTIWANLFYYIPNSNSYAFQVETTRLGIISRMVFWPVTYLTNGTSIFFQTQFLLVLSWTILAGMYVIQTKRYWVVLLTYLLLVLLNTRPPIGTLVFYHAFHSLPFFAVLLVSLGLFYAEMVKVVKSNRLKWMISLPILLVFFLILFHPGYYYRETISERDTPYVQFATIYTYSDAVRSLSIPGDTFAVYPYDELLYWYSGVPSPTRFLFLQSWVYDVPQYRQEINTALRQNPPAFVYARDTKLRPYLPDEDYLPLRLHEATRSALFIRRERLPAITDKQWEDIRRHGFEKPDLLLSEK